MQSAVVILLLIVLFALLGSYFGWFRIDPLVVSTVMS
jgi:hypothetical protein